MLTVMSPIVAVAITMMAVHPADFALTVVTTVATPLTAAHALSAVLYASLASDVISLLVPSLNSTVAPSCAELGTLIGELRASSFAAVSLPGREVS